MSNGLGSAITFSNSILRHEIAFPLLSLGLAYRSIEKKDLGYIPIPATVGELAISRDLIGAYISGRLKDNYRKPSWEIGSPSVNGATI